MLRAFNITSSDGTSTVFDQALIVLVLSSQHGATTAVPDFLVELTFKLRFQIHVTSCSRLTPRLLRHSSLARLLSCFGCV